MILPIVLILTTSLLAYVTTRGKRTQCLGLFFQSIRPLLEWIGAFAFFLSINLLLGLAVILVVRTFTERFMTVYELENPVFIVLSAVQGFIFQRWWARD